MITAADRAGGIRSSTTRLRRVMIVIAVAIGVRLISSGGSPATSYVAAVLFAAVLFAAVLVTAAFTKTPGIARRPPVPVMARRAVVGMGGAAVLVAFAALGRPILPAHPSASLVVWSVIVAAVAVTEELVFRGVLFNEVAKISGTVAAVVLCAALFALIHLPLYGVRALPVDLAAGIWLGAVRLWGGVGAAATAHALADLATGWFVL